MLAPFSSDSLRDADWVEVLLRGHARSARVDGQDAGRHRQQTHDLACGARQGSQGPLRHALPGAPRTPARVVACGPCAGQDPAQRVAVPWFEPDGPAHGPPGERAWLRLYPAIANSHAPPLIGQPPFRCQRGSVIDAADCFIASVAITRSSPDAQIPITI